MNMKELLPRSRSMQEAAEAKKGLIWILELLIFVVVFIASTFAQMLIMIPAELIMMFTDKGYMDAAASGDSQAILEATMALQQKLMSSDVYSIVMLFSDIMIILVVFLFCRLLQKRKLRTLGFVKKDILKEYGIGILAGFAFFSVCVGLGLITGGLKFGGISPEFSIGIFVLYLLGYMVQGMAEEVLCRGYFLGSYARRYPVYAAVLANSLLFAALHLLNSGISVLAIVNLTLFGIFASLYFVRRGSIWGIGAFHTVWNLVQGNFYGIKVSGMSLGNTFLTMNPVEGKELLNGGDFGMEGSLICTLVYVIGIIWLLTRKNKDGEVETTVESAVAQ